MARNLAVTISILFISTMSIAQSGAPLNEMYGKTAKSPMDELSAWLRVVMSTVDNVPAIVAHSLTEAPT